MRNQNTVTKSENKVLFPLGQIFLTIGAQDALEEACQLPNEFLVKHQKGEWGLVSEDAVKENDLSVKEGFQILSAYKPSKHEKIWIITEANRESTTLLLPEEY